MTRSIVLLLLLSAACTFAPAADNPQAQGGADIAYDLPRDAEVTINILDSKGWIVRELIRGENQKAGKQTVHWDGCDQSNRPLPPGDYAWKLIHHTGLNAEYVLSVANSGQPPYRTDDDKGSWGGCHGNPVSLQADEAGLYITWVCEEGNAVFAKTDYDGKAIFKIHASQGFGANWAAAISGDNLYRVERGGFGPFLMKFSSKTGQYVNWEAKDATISGAKLKLAEEQPDAKDPTRKVEKHPQGLAANDTFVVVGFPDFNELAVFKATGEKVKNIKIESPRGLVFLPDGRLAVCHAKEVATIDLATDKVTPLITTGVDSPWGITVARDAKSLWVTDQGTSHQVKQFDFSGKLVKAFGKQGGMPTQGKIDHNSFFMPRGIACGADGNIYVSEDSALRRISRWSPAGKLLREWFGPLGPQKTCWPNKNDFSEIYYQHWGTIIQCKVDLEAKTWLPVAWYTVDVPNGVQPYVWERAGHKYLFTETSKIFMYDKKADRWQVVVDFMAGNDKKRMIWSDLNLDGKASEDELTPNGTSLGFGHIDSKTLAISAVANNGLTRFEPEKIADNGVPVYTIERMKALTKEPATGTMNSWYDPFPIYGVHGCEPASDGGVFTAINGGRQQGRTFWDRASWNRIIKFDAEGNQVWRAGVHMDTHKTAHGEFCMIFRICGASHGLVFFNDVEVQINAYTEDGMFVDTLMDNEGPLTPRSLTVELMTGLVADDPKTGKPYLFVGSTEDARIFELTGYETIERMGGKLALKTAGPLQTLEKADQYLIASSKPPRKPSYNDGGADGFLTDPEWQDAKCLPLVEDGKLYAKVYLRYDDNDLWVAADVWDSSPAANAAQDVEQAFSLGDCVDLSFGDAASNSAEPGVGDLRVLLIPTDKGRIYNGKIVIYRPKLADRAAKVPFEFASPVGMVPMDYVAELKPVENSQRPCSFFRWQSGLGYTCEARIPLSALPELGMPVAADKKIKFDCGVIYSNIGGNNREKRVYWHQSDANSRCITDIPTEAKLSPQAWGTAVIAPKK